MDLLVFGKEGLLADRTEGNLGTRLGLVDLAGPTAGGTFDGKIHRGHGEEGKDYFRFPRRSPGVVM